MTHPLLIRTACMLITVFVSPLFIIRAANALTQSIPAAFFGMHIHDNNSDTPWPSVPVGSIRLHDTRTTWALLEPENNQWDFEKLDHAVNQAYEHKSEILFTLGQTPKWAAARPNDPTMYGPNTTGSEPKNIEDWRDYVRTVATRYKGKIMYYEVWNEPNYQPFYTGSVEKMVELARAADEVLHEVDPAIKVVSPAATTAGDGDKWLDAYLKAGGGQYVDIIAYHFYVDNPEQLPREIEKIKTILAKYNQHNKELWNTEFGWCIRNTILFTQNDLHGICPTMSDILDNPTAASYILRVTALSWKYGIDRMFWYSWDAETMGLTQNNGRTMKASGIAFRTVQQWLTGKDITMCKSPSYNVWYCQLTGSSPSYVVWNAGNTKNFTIPSNWNVARYETLQGKKGRAQPSTTLRLTREPLLLQL